MYSQEKLVEKGVEFGHWPAFERRPHKKEHREHITGSIVGMIYDTTGWPVPDEVYRPDNWAEWHCDDPNQPVATGKELEFDCEYEERRERRRKAAYVAFTSISSTPITVLHLDQGFHDCSYYGIYNASWRVASDAPGLF